MKRIIDFLHVELIMNKKLSLTILNYYLIFDVLSFIFKKQNGTYIYT